jgi:hypothetical protein
MAQTSLLLHPTIEECRRAAVAEGMPEREGDKFFHHYNGNGWKIGKNGMKSFSSSMAGWRLRWEDRGSPGKPAGNGSAPAPASGAMVIVKQKELERVLDRMKVIHRSYDSHNDLRPGDRAEMSLLKKRAGELRKELGVMI